MGRVRVVQAGSLLPIGCDVALDLLFEVIRRLVSGFLPLVDALLELRQALSHVAGEFGQALAPDQKCDCQNTRTAIRTRASSIPFGQDYSDTF